MTSNGHFKRLVIVSNRLPFAATEGPDGLQFARSPGGLVSGLCTYLQRQDSGSRPQTGYIWVGWPGATISTERRSELTSLALGKFNSSPVFLSQEEMDAFYLGFCNKTIWPLFHYFPSYVEYREEFWRQYVHVNEVFRDAVAALLRPGDYVWVHDYHLMLLPKLLRTLKPDIPIGFFLHIPFPSFEVFRLLPAQWRKEILEGMLGADLNGFHTYEYVHHFLQSVMRILGYDHQMGQVVTAERIVKTGIFPIGVDYVRHARATEAPEVLAERDELKKVFPRVKVILSVDRLDYTKGIINRLQGFERLLETHPRFREKVVLLMVVVPSRIGVHQYDLMKKQIEELVGKVNGRFGSISWTPIVYQYRSLSFYPLVALYSASDVALVTPLRDGMNLVAKEYVATRDGRGGVLILSEMAGAAKELGEAIIVNPNTADEIAEALREALEMPPEEQLRRNRIMQDRLRRYTVSRWADEFIRELQSVLSVQGNFYAKLLSPSEKQRISDVYSDASRRLILLDYDGTLVPLARLPHLAKPGPHVLRVLRDLSDDFRNTCILFSGRDRNTLQQWFGDLPVTLIAEHGVWIRDVNEDWKMLSEHSNGWKPYILPILQQYADRLPGSFVEEKEYSLAWHYRAADPEQAMLVVGETMDHLVSFTANLDVEICRGHKVIEVRNTGSGKGTAAMHWVSRGDHDFILAAGDDWTDEDMFKVLPQSAYSIRVGITNTHAHFNLRGPSDMIRLLEETMKPVGIPSVTL